MLSALLVVVVGLASAACGSPKTEQTVEPARPALRTTDGKPVSLADYKGRPLFLAFMTST